MVGMGLTRAQNARLRVLHLDAEKRALEALALLDLFQDCRRWRLGRGQRLEHDGWGGRRRHYCCACVRFDAVTKADIDSLVWPEQQFGGES